MAVVDAPARPDLGLPPRPDTRAADRLGARPTPQPASREPRPIPSQGANTPRPTRPRAPFRAMRGLHALLARNRVWAAAAAWLEAHPGARRAFTSAERVTKERLFGCRMCGQCALPSTAYACPMTCPKQLRNGPCGGVAMDGSCEVYPGTRCVWLIAYERAEQDDRVADLRRLQRPIDQRRWGESSWINYWLGRDEGLWTRDGSLQAGRLALPIVPATGAPAWIR